MKNTIQYPVLRKLVQSKHLDLFAAILIFGVCYYRDFQGTVYFDGKMQFGVPFLELGNYMRQGAFPLGIVSIVAAIFSVLSTRLVGKQNNWGNFIGILTTISAGVIDYLFGNHSAVITYPLTFFINSFAFSNWKKGERIRKRDTYYYLIIGVGILLGFALVYLGAYIFGGRTDAVFLNLVAVVFGLSIGGNMCNAYKYEETWFSWVVYNVVQLIKNGMQLNFANVAKYIFYLFNATVTLMDWKWNGDANKGEGWGREILDSEVAAD
ncbi:MAG TPA: hypothetical protein ENJ53_01195 [Phaeodactylibacter sp.]|nr:hypothetical protein [Phaeodactylibacter sp.]